MGHWLGFFIAVIDVLPRKKPEAMSEVIRTVIGNALVSVWCKLRSSRPEALPQFPPPPLTDGRHRVIHLELSRNGVRNYVGVGSKGKRLMVNNASRSYVLQ